MTRTARSIPWIIASRLLGIVVFLVVLVVAKIVASTYDNAFFSALVNFLYGNLGLIIFIGILFLVAECFGVFVFPLNLPAPLFNAIASIFLVSFIIGILEFVNGYFMTNGYLGIDISPTLDILVVLLYPLIFILVLIVGYYEIFSGIGREEQRPAATDRPTPPSSSDQTAKSWEEIGDEVRQAIYDFVPRFREEINRR